MVRKGTPDRTRAKPGTNFQAMRKKARAGKLRGKTYAGDGAFSGPTTAKSVSSKVVDVTKVVLSSVINSPKSNHDPRTPQYKPQASDPEAT